MEYDAGTGKCKPLDSNKVCAGGSIKGYTPTGGVVCYPGPTPPPPPAIIPCSSWTAWAPGPENTCTWSTAVQSRTCLSNGINQSRAIAGTKSGTDCCNAWSSWLPDASSQCLGANVSQTRTCLDAGNPATQTRTVTGTQAAPPCCNDWAPSPANTCDDATLAQTNSCGQSRTVAGTKDCNTGGCTYRHPIVWSTTMGRTVARCAEYFLRPGDPTTETRYRNGEVVYFTAGFCPNGSCYGQHVTRCVNGNMVTQSSRCFSGPEP